MKKVLLTGMVFCGLFIVQNSYSQDVMNGAANAASAAVDATAGTAGAASDAANGQISEQTYWSRDGKSWNEGSCAIQGHDEPREAHPCGDQKVEGGDCYCLYCHYEPCTYYTKRCVTENKYCQKKCSRQVPKYYDVKKCKMVTENYCDEVQRCKMVPQYYTEKVQRCRMVPQYYTEEVQRCKQVPQYYTEKVQRCRQVPQYYTEQACKYETEYYYETECVPCKKWVSDKHVKYVPRYYYKRVSGCAAPAAAAACTPCGN